MRAPHAVLPALLVLAAGAGAYVAFGAPPVQTPSLSSAPANPTNQLSATFAFSAGGGVSAYECSFDASAFAACTSPRSYAGPLEQGPHTFAVRALKNGATGSPAGYTWVVDTTPPPAPAIGSAPPNPSDDRTPSFAFTASEAGESFLCSLDAGAFAACANPLAYATLAIGLHAFQVKGRDAAGNMSVGATSYSWAIVPPAPTITAGPADPTAQAGAAFSFNDALAGATFVCALDGAAFAACASPKSYSGPLAEGSHGFQVKAVSNAQQSVAKPYAWRIDVSPPAIATDFPAGGGAYNASAWNAGCPGGPGLCGTASDPSGIDSASVSIQQLATARFWNGSSFGATTETFNAITQASGSATSVSARYPLALPTAGLYRVHVRARDLLGNASTSATQTTVDFSVDSTSPPQPAIAGHPPSPTSADSATFSFTDTEAGVNFQCKLDGGASASCSAPTTVTDLSAGVHSLAVQARDAAGNLSAAATFTWTIVAAVPFTIHGSAGDLQLGVVTPVPVTIDNPNDVPIYVTELVVVLTTNAGSGTCTASNFTTTSWTAVGPPVTAEVLVPAHATGYPVPAAARPKVRLSNLAVNQDACKSRSFGLTFSGSAHS